MRFGLIGTGYWATETHAAALAASSDSEFVGVWGRSTDKADALAERYGVRRFDAPDAMFDEVEAVAIAVPPDVQADFAVRAAGAGKHLLLDKPLALSTADADRVVAAVEQSGVSSLVFFTRQFSPEHVRWQEDARKAAGWSGASVSWLSCALRVDSPYAKSGWRREKGALWDVGPHALAAVLPVLGEVTRVAAVRGPADTVHALLEHDHACTVLSLSLTVPPAAARTSVEFYGERGWSAMPDSPLRLVEACGEAIGQLEAMAAAGATRHPCDVRFGAAVTALLQRTEEALPER